MKPIRFCRRAEKSRHAVMSPSRDRREGKERAGVEAVARLGLKFAMGCFFKVRPPFRLAVRMDGRGLAVQRR
jgi:hypothetical protein